MQKIRTTAAAFAALTFAGAAMLTSAPAALASTAIVDDHEMPSAEEILDRYIEVTGGEEAYRAVTSRVITSKLEIVGQGITADLLIKEKAPNLSVQSMEIPGMMRQSGGYDGQTAWAMDTMQGPRLLEGAELSTAMRDADFYSELNVQDQFSTIEVTGKEEFQGEQAYTVVFTPEGDEAPETRYYSVDSGLLLGSVANRATPQGEIAITTSFGDYKDVDGITLPHLVEIGAMGMTQRITVQSFEQDVEIPAEEFAPPEDVQAIME